MSQDPFRGAHQLLAFLSRRGLNPIKLAYDPGRPDGHLNLTASAFNQLDASSAGRRTYCLTHVFFRTMAVIIASTHRTYT